MHHILHVVAVFLLALKPPSCDGAPCGPAACQCGGGVRYSCSNNNLTAVPHDISQYGTGFDYIVLDHNRITHLGPHDFLDLPHVELMDLSYNMIEDIDAGAFDEVTAVTLLNLGNNCLTTLDKDVFSGLPNLETLFLNDNQLTEISADVLRFATNLQTLYLNNNWRINSFPDTFLHNSPMLHEFNAAGFPNMTSIPENLFLNCSRISMLDLSNNSVPEIPVSLLSTARSSLSTFTFSYNSLIREIPFHAFNNFPKMTAITLSNLTNLRYIAQNAFAGMPNLMSLKISQCQSLTSIHPSAFSALALRKPSCTVCQVFELSLADNALTSLPGGEALVPEWSYVFRVRLDGNPWRCDCHLLWIKGELVAHKISPESAANLRCLSPPPLRGKLIMSELNTSDLVCPGDSGGGRTAAAITAVSVVITGLIISVIILLWWRHKRIFNTNDRNNSRYISIINGSAVHNAAEEEDVIIFNKPSSVNSQGQQQGVSERQKLNTI